MAIGYHSYGGSGASYEAHQIFFREDDPAPQTGRKFSKMFEEREGLAQTRPRGYRQNTLPPEKFFLEKSSILPPPLYSSEVDELGRVWFSLTTLWPCQILFGSMGKRTILFCNLITLVNVLLANSYKLIEFKWMSFHQKPKRVGLGSDRNWIIWFSGALASALTRR